MEGDYVERDANARVKGELALLDRFTSGARLVLAHALDRVKTGIVLVSCEAPAPRSSTRCRRSLMVNLLRKSGGSRLRGMVEA